MLRYRPQLDYWDLCPLRRGDDDLGIYLDRAGRGLASLIGWRIIVPRWYVIVVLRAGRHRPPSVLRELAMRLMAALVLKLRR